VVCLGAILMEFGQSWNRECDDALMCVMGCDWWSSER